MSRSARVLVNDYAGHPFQIELSRELASRGHETTHNYCSTNIKPHGDLSDGAGIPLVVEGLSTGNGFDKYNATRRLLAELRYGLKSGWEIVRRRPAVILTSNMPIISLAIVRLVAAVTRTRSVLWLQDFQAGLAAIALGSDGHPIARALRWLESQLIRRSHHVVAISDAFADEVRFMGVTADRVTTIENWAPIDQLPVRPRDNDWAERHGLVDELVFLYSGTLGIKNRPESLVDLALELDDRNRPATLVVVSEGIGADWLAEQVATDPRLQNLLLLPFQPFDDLPDVMASADVLVVLLEPDAGRFSVPSKVLTYLCAERPVLGLVPADNAAASLIAEQAGAGLVTDSPEVLIKNARLLADDWSWRETCGLSGRAWAEEHFSIRAIADRFETVLFPESAERGYLYE